MGTVRQCVGKVRMYDGNAQKKNKGDRNVWRRIRKGVRKVEMCKENKTRCKNVSV